MKHELDEYAGLDSAVHEWAPRLKMIGLLTLIFAFAFVDDLRLLPPMVLVTALIFVVSRLPIRFLAQRLKVPGLFIGFLVISLPFLSGQTVLADLGPVSIRQEGVETALLIMIRFGCIITLSLILFGTAKLTTNLKVLRSLRVPDIMVDMLLLTYRYLFELRETFNQTRTAVRLRGFDESKLSRSSLSTLAALLGNLMVRSYEQSERVYKAMILRGYGHGPLRNEELVATGRDRLFLWIAVGTAVLFVGIQILLQQLG